VPSSYLIPRVIRHILNTSACGTLVVPSWPSAPFWPMLFPKIGKVASFVADLVLAKSELSIIPGSSLFNGHRYASLKDRHKQVQGPVIKCPCHVFVVMVY